MAFRASSPSPTSAQHLPFEANNLIATLHPTAEDDIPAPSPHSAVRQPSLSTLPARLPSTDLRGPDLELALALTEICDSSSWGSAMSLLTRDSATEPFQQPSMVESHDCAPPSRAHAAVNLDQSAPMTSAANACASDRRAAKSAVVKTKSAASKKTRRKTAEQMIRIPDSQLTSLEVPELIRLATAAGLPDEKINALKIRRRKLKNRSSARGSAQRRRTEHSIMRDALERSQRECQQWKNQYLRLSSANTEVLSRESALQQQLEKTERLLHATVSRASHLEALLSQRAAQAQEVANTQRGTLLMNKVPVVIDVSLGDVDGGEVTPP
eukprot:m.126807 g.126807  ORF g.126807 m.126807 type:complete len:326 (-) comp17390_c0_seq1:160-1137(-)